MDTQLISLRVPVGLLEYFDALAKKQNRSRAYIIIEHLKASSGDRLPKAPAPLPRKTEFKRIANQIDAIVAERRAKGECPHGYNDRAFCKTMKGGCV